MCGIAGVYGEQSPDQVNRMLTKLAHRGPDGQGLKNLPKGTLGHTRLAILDVDGGHQPMEAGGSWITFNGEIYNYRQLAVKHLQGVSLKTTSDTEVILHLYKKFGPTCVELLDGMFAFAILDGNELFMARDPLGIKSLYCGRHNGALYFASEIKALAEATDHIREFPAGHWYHSRQGWQAYYQIAPTHLKIETQASAAEAIREVLGEAVQKRLLADVPVGISLSGGLDSSIVALLAKQSDEPLHSFAVGMPGSPDLAAAEQVAAELNTIHHQRTYSNADMLRVLPEVLYHLESFDPALVRSAIPNYFLAEMAAEHVKVILTGEGADEIYAGYDYLRDYQNPDLLQQEMVDITAALHNTNLQRADRIAMAHGLEARVPFLDVESVALGLGLPAEWKVHEDKQAKFLLRQAFEDDLPNEIVNRRKQKFSQGAGSSEALVNLFEQQISDEVFEAERGHLLHEWNYALPNKEALYYLRLLREEFKEEWIFPSMGSSRSL
ncbi:MAG: asparagine synthase B [Anaerolineales bacterium]|nr:asparagine synthase B [Anaerolineales bacterium]